MKQMIRNSLILGAIGVFAGFIAIVMQIPNLPEDIVNQITEELGRIEILYVVGAVQVGVLTIVLSLIGQLLLPKTGFVLHSEWTKKSIGLAVLFGAVSAACIVAFDSLVFYDVMKEINAEYQFSISYFIAGILYGGIIEEVIMRLFLLTVIVYFLNMITKKKQQSHIYIAIIVTSILFGLGHLPAMQLLTPLTPIIITRTVLINMIPALLFGYLYTKKGLSYSMIAHIVTHIVLQLILAPIFL